MKNRNKLTGIAVLILVIVFAMSCSPKKSEAEKAAEERIAALERMLTEMSGGAQQGPSPLELLASAKADLETARAAAMALVDKGIFARELIQALEKQRFAWELYDAVVADVLSVGERMALVEAERAVLLPQVWKLGDFKTNDAEEMKFINEMYTYIQDTGYALSLGKDPKEFLPVFHAEIAAQLALTKAEADERDRQQAANQARQAEAARQVAAMQSDTRNAAALQAELDRARAELAAAQTSSQASSGRGQQTTPAASTPAASQTPQNPASEPKLILTGPTSLTRNGRARYIARVEGENSPAQDVHWGISANADGIGGGVPGVMFSRDANGVRGDGMIEFSTGSRVGITFYVSASVDVGSKSIRATSPQITIVADDTGPTTIAAVDVDFADKYSRVPVIAKGGGPLRFGNTVYGSNNVRVEGGTAVTWKVSSNAAGTGPVAAGTSIVTDNDGWALLRAGANESAQTLYAIATSRFDPSVSGVFPVTVSGATVSGISITKSGNTLPYGGSIQFNARVEGANNPPQDIVWTVTPFASEINYKQANELSSAVSRGTIRETLSASGFKLDGFEKERELYGTTGSPSYPLRDIFRFITATSAYDPTKFTWTYVTTMPVNTQSTVPAGWKETIFTVGTATGSRGQKVSIPIKVDTQDTPGLVGYQFYVLYDPERLSTPPAAMGMAYDIAGRELNPIVIMSAGINNQRYANETKHTIEFTVKPDAPSGRAFIAIIPASTPRNKADGAGTEQVPKAVQSGWIDVR
jgi:hypothetical protein